jgi:hypothetical protein
MKANLIRALDHQFFFSNKLVNYGKKFHSEYSLDAIYLILGSQDSSASCQTSTCLHIATQYHFAAKLYRQDWPEIASQSI